ncbi:MAG: PLP-dependent aminotransferase family protein [Isosphaeraceae bacterium]|nr:PLP-dependent aminotransferase family protein [Isosphaeraceae bacterium]
MLTNRSTTRSAISERTSSPLISQLMAAALGNPDLISLAAGFVDQQSLPAEATARAMEAILSDPVESRRALQYGTTIGDHRLRHEIVRLLERNEGRPEGSFEAILPRTLVTTGSQQLLYLLCEVLVEPGDIVIVESPTYFVFLGVLESRGARAIGVPIDDGGIDLGALEATLEAIEARGELAKVKLVYSITEHSNPSGLSLAPERRPKLLEIVKRFSKQRRIYLLEDAAYRGLNYSEPEPNSVWSMDDEQSTVILARTFSKTFSPGVKTGFSVVPEELVGPLLDLKGNHDFGSSNLNQMLLAKVLASGDYERQIAALLPVYKRKRDAMLSALETHFEGAEGVSWTTPKGGLFVWFTAPEGLDLGPNGPVVSRCLDRGVIYVPGNFALASEPKPPETNHARLCFGVPCEADLEEGVRRLAAVLADCMVGAA